MLAIHLPRDEWPDGYRIIPTREVNRFTSRTCSQGFKVIEDSLEMGPISKSNPDLCPGFEQKKSRKVHQFTDPDPGPEFDIKEVDRFTKVLDGMVV